MWEFIEDYLLPFFLTVLLFCLGTASLLLLGHFIVYVILWDLGYVSP